MTATHVAILLTILGAVATVFVYEAVNLVTAFGFALCGAIGIGVGYLAQTPSGRTASTSV